MSSNCRAGPAGLRFRGCYWQRVGALLHVDQEGRCGSEKTAAASLVLKSSLVPVPFPELVSGRDHHPPLVVINVKVEVERVAELKVDRQSQTLHFAFAATRRAVGVIPGYC